MVAGMVERKWPPYCPTTDSPSWPPRPQCCSCPSPPPRWCRGGSSCSQPPLQAAPQGGVTLGSASEILVLVFFLRSSLAPQSADQAESRVYIRLLPSESKFWVSSLASPTWLSLYKSTLLFLALWVLGSTVRITSPLLWTRSRMVYPILLSHHHAQLTQELGGVCRTTPG